VALATTPEVFAALHRPVRHHWGDELTTAPHRTDGVRARKVGGVACPPWRVGGGAVGVVRGNRRRA
jgi:hypothetical protein